jgi:hypothetical protein
MKLCYFQKLKKNPQKFNQKKISEKTKESDGIIWEYIIF